MIKSLQTDYDHCLGNYDELGGEVNEGDSLENENNDILNENIDSEQQDCSLENEPTAMKCIQMANDTYSHIQSLLNDRFDTKLSNNSKNNDIFEKQANCVNMCEEKKNVKEEEGDQCLVEAWFNDTKLVSLLDCGANCNIIDVNLYNKLENTDRLQETSEVLMVVGGKKANVMKTKIWVKLSCHKSPVLFNFYVMENIPFVILGTYFLKKMGIDMIISERSYMYNKMLYPFLNINSFDKLPNKFANRVTINESKQNDINNFNNLMS